jgi:hypothetical protein
MSHIRLCPFYAVASYSAKYELSKTASAAQRVTKEGSFCPIEGGFDHVYSKVTVRRPVCFGGRP